MLNPGSLCYVAKGNILKEFYYPRNLDNKQSFLKLSLFIYFQAVNQTSIFVVFRPRLHLQRITGAPDYIQYNSIKQLYDKIIQACFLN